MKESKLTQYLSHAAALAAVYSKDRSTQVSAIFIDSEDYTSLSSGYNGMPRGCLDHLEERHERPLKYDYTEHAERNAIFNIARPHLRDATVVTNDLLTMANARALISVNVAEVWSTHPDVAESPETLAQIKSFFEEANIQLHHFSVLKDIKPELSRHRRKIYQAASVLSSLSSSLAKDPYAKDTVFLSKDDYTRVSEGYSGLPRGVNDLDPSRYVGESRAFWVEDSIRNAIYNKVRPQLKGSTIIVTHVPCAECARAIAAVGAKAIAAPLPQGEFLARWSAQIDQMRVILDESGVQLIALTSDSDINLAKQIKEELTPAWHEDCPHVPHTPQMVRDFIGHNFNSYSEGDKVSGAPHANDTYNVSAHDLMSAFYAHFSFEEGGASARLAANAPQLLNALQALVSAVEAMTPDAQQEQPAIAQAIRQAKQVIQQGAHDDNNE